MQIEQKVVGTTFAFEEQRPLKIDDFDGTISNFDGTPQLIGSAVLMPQPDNKFDPNAVMVIAKLKDGSTFRIGYLPRGSELYESVKKPVLARLIVLGYSVVGDYNDEYSVQVDL